MKIIISIEWLVTRLKASYGKLSEDAFLYQPFDCFLPSLLDYTLSGAQDDSVLNDLIMEIGRMGLSFSELDSFVTEAIGSITDTLEPYIGNNTVGRRISWELSNDKRSVTLYEHVHIRRKATS